MTIHELLNYNTMKIKIILYVFISVFFMVSGCIKTDCKIDTCGIENPQEVEWLKAILDNRFCTEVYSIYFNGKEYISVCDCPGPDAMIVIYDCQGTRVCEWGGIGGGGSTCNMPTSFTYDYYERHKKFIYKQN
jgi:hypothetical protein